MKRKNDKIIRPGDWVRIIKPHVFVRCGYPDSVEEETVLVGNEFGNKIADFLKELGVEVSFFPHESKTYKKVVREIAYGRVKSRRFGGRDRTVHTRSEPHLVDKVVPVRGVRFVRTGKYYGPSGGYPSYYGEDDYEPGGLLNAKSHKILDVGDFEIEAIHVEKVEGKSKAITMLKHGKPHKSYK